MKNILRLLTVIIITALAFPAASFAAVSSPGLPLGAAVGNNDGVSDQPEAEASIVLPKQAAVSPSLSKQQSQSNGNTQHFGYATSTDRYHFYVGQLASGDALYRYDPKTKQTKQLTKGEQIYNLAVSGEWLYYLGENPNDDFYQAYALYKIKMDGTKKSLVVKKNDLTRFFSIHKGWIYFGNWQDDGKLYKMKLDGSQLKKLSNLEVSHINVWGDWLIFESSNRVYIYTTDGKELAKLHLGGRYVTVSEGFLYVSGFDGDITKVPLVEGTLQQEEFQIAPVLDYENYGDIEVINYKNNAAYMFIKNTNYIAKMKFDGSKPTAFVKIPKSGEVQHIWMAGDHMYYTVIYSGDGPGIDKRELYRVPLEGKSKPEKVYSVKVTAGGQGG